MESGRQWEECSRGYRKKPRGEDTGASLHCGTRGPSAQSTCVLSIDTVPGHKSGNGDGSEKKEPLPSMDDLIYPDQMCVCAHGLQEGIAQKLLNRS